MIREIYMVSILQLQKKKKSLICLEIGNCWMCFLYFMLCFTAHWNELAAMNEKKLLHLISGMNLDWMLLCRTSMKTLGPVPPLCLWMKRHEPHALLHRSLHPPHQALSVPSAPELGEIGRSLVEEPWPRKAFSTINALAWEISAVLSILLLFLLFSKSTCEPAARQPLWLVHLINGPQTKLWPCHILFLSYCWPQRLCTLQPRTGFALFCMRTYWSRGGKKNNQTKQKNLYHHTITLTAEPLFFCSPASTTTFLIKTLKPSEFADYTKYQICLG